MKSGKFLFLAALLLGTQAVAAEMRVAATTASMGALVRAVGGDAITVTVLVPRDRDAHHQQARPSMIRTLRRADLVVAVGAGLEEGWLPAAISSAANPRILQGQPGHFEAAAHVALRDVDAAADRSGGDVHAEGNPHLYLDPVRMTEAGQALAKRLGELDTQRAPYYLARAQAFGEMVATRVPEWQRRVQGVAGVVLYHKDADYLMERLAVPVHGYLEPLPGVPPTASHLSALVQRLSGSDGMILHYPYQPERGPRFLADALGWPVRVLPHEPPADADASGYLEHVERWVSTLASR